MGISFFGLSALLVLLLVLDSFSSRRSAVRRASYLVPPLCGGTDLPTLRVDFSDRALADHPGE
jgi:hypothetical protein